MRDIRFTPLAFEQYTDWQKTDKSVYNKINKLLVETARTPFEGSGNQSRWNMISRVIGAGELQMNTVLFTEFLMIILRSLGANFIISYRVALLIYSQLLDDEWWCVTPTPHGNPPIPETGQCRLGYAVALPGKDVTGEAGTLCYWG